MDFKALADKIENATKKEFAELYEQHKDEEIYSFSLYSDDGAMTVCPSANTIQFLDTYKDDRELLYYKFEPAEWKYESKGGEKEFDEICDLLYDELEKDEYSDDESFFNFKEQLFECCIRVLKTLKDRNYFENITGTDVFLIFSVSDSDSDYNKRSVTLLNDNPYKTEYLKWIEG